MAFNLFDWNTWFQPQEELFPQSQVQSAVQGGNAMWTGQNYQQPDSLPNIPTITPSTSIWNTQPTGQYAVPGANWSNPNTGIVYAATNPTPSSPTPQPGSNPYQPGTPQYYDWILSQGGAGSTTISPYQQAQMDAEKWQFTETQNRLNAQAAAEAKYREQQLAQQQTSQAAESAYRQQQLAWQQQQAAAQLEAEKQQRLAQLSAQPKSWLEYAALSNQAPVVQPWMLPLMPQDYQKTQGAGSPIAGWTPENMKGMPDLINPSAQYMARLTPSAREQYMGYQQADQGMTPEDTQWRLWSQAPAGKTTNLSYSR